MWVRNHFAILPSIHLYWLFVSFLASQRKHYDIHITFLPGAGDVWFSLNGTTYQNNSLVTLEDIGENDTALLCMTNLTACCRTPYTDEVLGNWFFPNETRVPSNNNNTDFYRDGDQMVVRLKRRRDGMDGIYRCEIPDAMNVTRTIYIGLYTADTGEWHCTLSKFSRSTVYCNA